MIASNLPDAEPARSKAQRVARNYRRARRKLLHCRKLGVQAVASYLAHSYLARRLAGVELRRPETIEPVKMTEREIAAYRAEVRAIELEKAIALGGEATARRIRLEEGLERMTHPGARDFMVRLFELGGTQSLVFGFADDSCRRVILLPGGSDVPDDGLPAVPLASLIHRAYRGIFASIISVRTAPGETVNVYEAKDAEFHPEPRREVYAAVVATGHTMLMTGEDAKEALAQDPRTMTALPRVAGTVYRDWPMLAPVDQEEQQ